MSEQRLTIRDDRTGKSYTLPIQNGTVRAMDLRQIKTDADDFGLMAYDPALMNTASTKSAITFIDGDKGNFGIPWLPGRATRGDMQLFGSRVPDSFWRVA